MPDKHALLSPSSSHRWLACPGSVFLSKDLADTAGVDAAEGTAAHVLAQRALTYKKDARFFIGEKIISGKYDFLVDEDMAQYVQVYLDYVRREAHGKSLLIEQALPLTPLTGEIDAVGTADAVIIDGDTLMIVDLKYGRGVEVDALDNEQMMMYAAAARCNYSLLGLFRNFKVVIVQPRRDHIDEFEFDSDKLDQFVTRIEMVAPFALDGTGDLNPSEDACRFCKAKAICPALAEKVASLTAGGFENLERIAEVDLGKSMALVGMVEDWCKATRAETERRLIAGVKVVGWKLVKGRMGARKWTDESAVKDMMKNKLRMADTQMYKFSLISPTQAEKIVPHETPGGWEALQGLITQSEGSPSVAPSTDPRPEIGGAMQAFDNIEG